MKRKIIYENGNRSSSNKAHYAVKKLLIEELRDVKGRLINDVGTYIDSIIHYNQTSSREVGFFGSIRIILPVIEHLAFILYGDKSRISRNKILKSLDLEYPEITWHIFRHPLIHGDEPTQITIGKLVVSWSIKLHNTPHQYETFKGSLRNPDTGKEVGKLIIIRFDTVKLYNDLLAFLDRHILQDDTEKFTYVIKESVLFKSKTKRKEINNIVKKKRVLINKEVLKELAKLQL